jgi:Tol biopolymer transport system component
VSTNGRFIAFASDADDLVPNDNNQCRDVFVRDLLMGTTVLASVGTNGASATGMSTEPAISGDGKYVAFTSFATNIVAGDTNNARDVFVRDLIAGTNELDSTATPGGYGNGDSYSPTLSTDGRYVLFRSLASNLGVGSFSGENLFFRDRQTQSTIALTTSGVGPGAMTPDGRAIAFVSLSNPLPGLYVWDSTLGRLVYTNRAFTSSISTVVMSPDARWVAYTTSSPLTFRARDLVMQSDSVICTGQVSVAATPKFSADARFLVYSTPSALDARDTNGVYDVYLYDFQGATNLLLCRGFDSGVAVPGGSTFADISADGRFIAYRSTGSNCVPNDSNQVSDVFLYDRSNGVTTVISASDLGNFTANRLSR